jgi:hypothetical protein
MKKLRLETLKVESFDTTATIGSLRGTVAAHEEADTLLNCPYSYGGTCVISCRPNTLQLNAAGAPVRWRTRCFRATHVPSRPRPPRLPRERDAA